MLESIRNQPKILGISFLAGNWSRSDFSPVENFRFILVIETIDIRLHNLKCLSSLIFIINDMSGSEILCRTLMQIKIKKESGIFTFAKVHEVAYTRAIRCSE